MIFGSWVRAQYLITLINSAHEFIILIYYDWLLEWLFFAQFKTKTIPTGCFTQCPKFQPKLFGLFGHVLKKWNSGYSPNHLLIYCYLLAWSVVRFERCNPKFNNAPKFLYLVIGISLLRCLYIVCQMQVFQDIVKSFACEYWSKPRYLHDTTLLPITGYLR